MPAASPADGHPPVDFERIFDETPVPLLLLTPDLVIVGANRARLEATATTLEATVGRGLFEVFPMNPDDPGADGLVNLRDSLTLTRETRRPQTMAVQKYDIPMPDGTYEERFWSPLNVPILDEHGEVVLLLHRSDDITDYVHTRHQAQASAELSERLRERAERVEHDLFARTRELEQLVAHLGRATARAELLSTVTSELTSTLDGEQAVGRLAQLVVPLLADWCIVSLTVDDRHDRRRDETGVDTGEVPRALRDVGSWHAEETMRPVVAEYAATRLGVLRSGSLLDQALATGRPQARTARALDYLTSVLAPGRARDLVTELAPESLLTLPLRARGRTLGALMLANGAARSPITAEEIATATDIAGRAGLALDNARLYRQQRELAEALQRSLLTDPAQPDHLQVAVRYTPAAETAQVGGGLVRLLRPARRHDDPDHRRRPGSQHRRCGGDGAGPVPPAGDRRRRRRRTGGGPDRRGPCHGDPGRGHDGDGGRGPGRADGAGALPGGAAPGVVQRRAPATGPRHVHGEGVPVAGPVRRAAAGGGAGGPAGGEHRGTRSRLDRGLLHRRSGGTPR